MSIFDLWNVLPKYLSWIKATLKPSSIVLNFLFELFRSGYCGSAVKQSITPPPCLVLIMNGCICFDQVSSVEGHQNRFLLSNVRLAFLFYFIIHTDVVLQTFMYNKYPAWFEEPFSAFISSIFILNNFFRFIQVIFYFKMNLFSNMKVRRKNPRRNLSQWKLFQSQTNVD